MTSLGMLIVSGMSLIALGAASSAETNTTSAPATYKECSAKYQAAKAEGSLGAQKWQDYKRRFCGIVARGPALPAARSEAARAEIINRVAFPATAHAPIAGETPGRARMRTCLEAYHANKKAGALFGLRWIEKGGGYYSMCNARLKQPGA